MPRIATRRSRSSTPGTIRRSGPRTRGRCARVFHVVTVHETTAAFTGQRRARDDRRADDRRVRRRQRRHRDRLPARRRHPAVERRRVPGGEVRRRPTAAPAPRTPTCSPPRRSRATSARATRRTSTTRTARCSDATARRRTARSCRCTGASTTASASSATAACPGDAGRVRRRAVHVQRPRGRRRGARVPRVPDALLRGVPGGERVREHGAEPGLAVPRRRRPRRSLPHHDRHAAAVPGWHRARTATTSASERRAAGRRAVCRSRRPGRTARLRDRRGSPRRTR